MAEYTPTTDEIVRYYIDGSRDWFPGLTASERNERFDRWLAEVRREAAEKAWDEGYEAGCHDSAENEQRFQMRDWWSDPPATKNPYRQKEADRG